MATTIGTPAWVQALTYAAADDRQVLRTLFSGAGVVPGTLAVAQNGTPNMSVNVAAGQAVIARSSSTPQDYYVAESPNAATNLVIATSDPTNPRIDLIIIRVNDAQYSGGVNNATVEVVTGTPAGSPVQPATPNTALLLATVAVAASAATIVNANITDKRVPWKRVAPSPSLITFSTPGTTTLTAAQAAGAVALRIEGCNGGSGAGGTAATGAATVAVGTSACGAPSAIRTVALAGLTFPLQVVVGAGATATAAGANNGNIGGQSSVTDNNGGGSVLWTPGTNDGNSHGFAGTAGGASAGLGGGFSSQGNSPVADIALPGDIPSDGMRISTTQPYGTSGGSSKYGNGGFRGLNVAGSSGGFGGGGGSTVAGNNQAAIVGSGGGSGLVIFTLIY